MSAVEFLDGMDYRVGFNALEGKPKGTAITSQDPTPIMGGTGQTTQFALVKVKTLEDFQRALDINIDASMSYGIFSASAAFNFAETQKFHSYHEYVVAKVNVVNPLSMIHDIKFNDTASNLLSQNNMSRFQEEFGDSFIQGIQTGGAYYALLEFETNSADEQQKVDAKLDFGILLFGGGDVKFSESLQDIHQVSNSTIKSFQLGGRDQTQPTEIQQVINKASKFANDVANSGVPIRALIQDYKTLDYPAQPNFIDIENARLTMNHYFRIRNVLQSKLNDIEFIRENPNQFTDIDMYDIPGKEQQIEGLLDVIKRNASACVNNVNTCQFSMPDIPLFELPIRKAEVEGQPSFPNITGRWYADDDGRYYLRQTGNDVWWYAEYTGPPSGFFWTNVFHGKIYGDKIVGDWADVPKNIAVEQVTNYGKLTLTVDRSGSKFTWTEGLGTPYRARIWRPLVS